MTHEQKSGNTAACGLQQLSVGLFFISIALQPPWSYLSYQVVTVGSSQCKDIERIEHYSESMTMTVGYHWNQLSLCWHTEYRKHQNYFAESQCIKMLILSVVVVGAKKKIEQ